MSGHRAPIPTAAVARNADQVDAFVVDPGGQVQTLWHASNSLWNGPKIVLPASYAIPPGAPLSVVSRKVDATGDPVVDRSRAEQLSAVAPAGAEVSAWAPHAGSIEVAARKGDGTLVHTWFADVENGIDQWQLADQ